MAKNPTILLPPGVAVWPKLDEIDVYQPVDKKGRPNGAEKRRYITKVRYDDAVREQIEAKLKKFAVEAGQDEDTKLPFKKNKKTGEYELEATRAEKLGPPAVFDAKNKKVPAGIAIGGGSIIRLEVAVNAYDGFGGGVNLYINSVQLLKLEEKGGSSSKFEEAEGFSYEGSGDDDDAGDAEDHNEASGEDAYKF